MKKLLHSSLALAITLVLVLSTCFIGGTMAVSAREYSEEYSLSRTVKASTAIDAPSEVEAICGDLSESLISGKKAYYYNGKNYVEGDDETFSSLTDGKIIDGSANKWFNTSFSKNFDYTYNGLTYKNDTGVQRMYYDLGDVCEVDSIVLVDATNYLDPDNVSSRENDLTLPEFKLYLSKNTSGHLMFDIADLSVSYSFTELESPLDSEENLNKSNYAIVYNITFPEPVDARYVGFEFPEYANMKSYTNSVSSLSNAIVLYEIAVFGEDLYNNVEITQKGYNNTDVINSSGIDFSKSVISGKNAYVYDTAKGTSQLGSFEGKKDYKLLTDAVFNDNGTTGVFNQRIGGSKNIYYDMTDTYEVNKVVLVDFSGWSGDLRLPSFEVYGSLTDKDGNLFKESNKLAVASCNEAIQPYVARKGIVYTITFAEPVNARYIGFKFPYLGCLKGDTSAVVLSEIALFGDIVIPDYTVTTTSGTESDILPTTAEENIIYGKTISESHSNAFAHLTDGINDLTGKGSKGGWPYKLTYTLDGPYKITEVQLLSGTNTNRVGEFEIYISNSLETLYNEENLKATVNGTAVDWASQVTTIDKVTFSEDYATKGMYFGLVLTKPNPNAVLGDGGNYYTGERETNATETSELIVKGTKLDAVIATAGKGGSIDPEGTTILNGEEVVYTVESKDGYKLDKVLVNGEVADLTDGKYTFGATATGWNTIEAIFYLIGDANNDAVIDEQDLALVRQYILGYETEGIKKYANVVGEDENKITVLDLVGVWELMQ